ncbi:MAG: outer membrane lipoprotein carrier protein LolA [Ignavibacterium sp.]|jgi:outer membrane lipoprotein-sorting protein|nr:outer membrane lipoprotein carrier protein LolA [Ignavibacterium sp.]
MKFLISILVLFYSIVGFAQNAESVLKSLQNKFDSITDLTVDVIQKSNGKSSFSGKMYYKRGSKLRIEIGNQTIVADGKTSWNYNKKNNKVIISDYDETGSGLLSINYLVYQYPSECDLSLSAEGSSQILNLKPKSKKNNLGEVKLFINKENLIEKAIISNPSSGTMEITFSNYKLNQNLSDSRFSFTAPEGTTVVDLR